MPSFTTPYHQQYQMEFATYSMAEDGFGLSRNNHKRGNRKRTESDDENGSLTYSAGSSITSCNSAAGESTDSSFAGIMKVLTLQEGPELEALMRREGIDARTLAKAKLRAASDSLSVASSLNYSTDGESAVESVTALLNGEECLQTITGQPSDSLGPDGGGFGLGTENIIFAPAEPIDRKRRRHKKNSGGTPSSKKVRSPKTIARKSSSHRQHQINYYDEEDSPKVVERKKSTKPIEVSKRTPSQVSQRTPLQVCQRNPPQVSERTSSQVPQRTSSQVPQKQVPQQSQKTDVMKEDNSFWYARLWMCGITDAFRGVAELVTNDSL